jgi:diaminohydroxyphosphoribosylaminopyrimidine deaminase/5-amino-6-(5-phosphoribosylamino)uracil reductase
VREDSPKARALRRAGVEVVRLSGRASKPDLSKAIAELGRRQILSVMLEAGSILNSAAMAADLVDKMRIFYAPKFAGPAAITRGVGAVAARPHDVQELQNVTVETFGPDFAIEGYLHDVYRTR